MKIMQTIQRIPAGLMVVPLMLGALLNTIDQAHIGWIESILRWMGASPAVVVDGVPHYEFLPIGGFHQALFKDSAPVLIGLFLFCAAAQMNLRVAGKALKKGLIITTAKYATGVAVGYLLGVLFDPFHGLLGLSTLAIIAAMTNSNGGMYAALTGQYGNRSDVGAIAILSINDGPFLTLLALGMLGNRFPLIAFLAVLLPIALGLLLGNLDEDIRKFLKPGTVITIPFFAFSLGAGLNFGQFLNVEVLGGGLLLGVMTTVLTGIAGVAALKLFRERSQIAGVAEASTAGNAAGTPLAVLTAAEAAHSQGMMSAGTLAQFRSVRDIATAQIGISVLLTAVLCPLVVILWARHQNRRGIDGTVDEPAEAAPAPAPAVASVPRDPAAGGPA